MVLQSAPSVARRPEIRPSPHPVVVSNGRMSGDWDEGAFLAGVLGPLQAGDPAATESAIAFLEADPWEFRSGYAKRKVMSALAHRPLDDAAHRRLARVLLHHVDVGERLEFRASCRLARRLGPGALRDPLVQRLDSGDLDRARRAAVMLASMRGARLDARAVDSVRRLVLRLTPARTFSDERPEIVQLLVDSARHRDRRLLRFLAVQVWSFEWEERLLRLAEGDQPGRSQGLAVLRALPRLHSDDHHARFEGAVARAKILDRS